MTTGMASGIAQSVLDALCRSVTWSEPAGFFVKLHLADPGSAGTTSPAAETDRSSATFSAAAADGTITNSADITWTSVSNTETYSHVSFWSASTSGTFLGSDALVTPRAITTGESFTIAAGDIVLSIVPIAAD